MTKVTAATKCIFEFDGFLESIYPGKITGKKKQAGFQLLFRRTAILVEYNLLKSRNKALRVLEKEKFNSRIMKADKIELSNRKVGVDYGNFYFKGIPELKKTWRVLNKGEEFTENQEDGSDVIRNYIARYKKIIEITIVYSNGKKKKYTFPKYSEDKGSMEKNKLKDEIKKEIENKINGKD